MSLASDVFRSRIGTMHLLIWPCCCCFSRDRRYPQAGLTRMGSSERSRLSSIKCETWCPRSAGRGIFKHLAFAWRTSENANGKELTCWCPTMKASHRTAFALAPSPHRFVAVGRRRCHRTPPVFGESIPGCSVVLARGSANQLPHPTAAALLLFWVYCFTGGCRE
jgi:hypothetical protein